MLVGVKLGSFTLENVLGSGGFGAVYFTRNEQGQPLAVKVLFPPRSRESADIADYTSRLGHFQREIQFAASFRHPNIMRIHFSGSLFWHYDDPSDSQPRSYRSGDYNLPYYVTDDLPDSVEQRLRSGLFGSSEAVEIGKQVCEALEALHSADPRILHLDLNPSNVRLAEGGRVVITDFGLVRVEGMPQGEVTRETFMIPPYVAAPEQRVGEDLDIRTDIYQLGALLFLMVTGESRRESTVTTLLDQSSMPLSLARAIDRCTRHEKEWRFQDVSAVKEALVAAKASRFEKFIQMPIQSLSVHLARLDARVPPLWKHPVTWLLGAFLGFAILWVMGLILSPDEVKITIASSSTKKEWLTQAVTDFNEASRTDASWQISGNPIRLKNNPIVVEILLERVAGRVPDHWRSGAMIKAILATDEKLKIEPTIASPAETFYIQELKEEWRGSKAEISWSIELGQNLSNSMITNSEAPGLLRTPLVIAMWRSRAEALGCWPASGPECTWETLGALASSTDGWGMFGRPEWGKLKYGIGFVGKSNSATSTEVLICMSSLKKRSGLTIDEVRAGTPCGEAMADFKEAGIREFARGSLAFDAMRDNPPGYLDAVTTYEVEVIEVNDEFGLILPEPIVAVYPQDGTFVPNHPFAILDRAPWVDSA